MQKEVTKRADDTSSLFKDLIKKTEENTALEKDLILKNDAIDRAKGRRNLRGLLGTSRFVITTSLESIRDQINVTHSMKLTTTDAIQ